MELFNNLKKVVLVIEYEGERYCGFQWQKGSPTVQDELEKAIQKLTAESVKVIAACRTDTGVHAIGQVVSFRTHSELPPQTFIRGLNHYLPGDISVTRAGFVSERFNVRKEALKREYEYRILNRQSRSPLVADYSFLVPYKLNIESMNTASGLLIGEHDFASFVTTWDRKEKSTVRRVYEAEVIKKDDMVTVRIVANSFLTHQVRNTAGTLLQVGSGKIGVEEFKNILEAKRLSLAGPTAPAKGLCLTGVIYPENSEFKYENLCT
ncbi:MAG: tRNA pseudouridine(38-40) synthase TruA [Chloroflexi bacterium]|nr:tRNA pseudouridine(38-40) synthase TruA [Chloroflexota bacterium]